MDSGVDLGYILHLPVTPREAHNRLYVRSITGPQSNHGFIVVAFCGPVWTVGGVVVISSIPLVGDGARE